jgi:hypothetical protein
MTDIPDSAPDYCLFPMPIPESGKATDIRAKWLDAGNPDLGTCQSGSNPAGWYFPTPAPGAATKANHPMLWKYSCVWHLRNLFHGSR